MSWKGEKRKWESMPPAFPELSVSLGGCNLPRKLYTLQRGANRACKGRMTTDRHILRFL